MASQRDTTGQSLPSLWSMFRCECRNVETQGFNCVLHDKAYSLVDEPNPAFSHQRPGTPSVCLSDQSNQVYDTVLRSISPSSTGSSSDGNYIVLTPEHSRDVSPVVSITIAGSESDTEHKTFMKWRAPGFRAIKEIQSRKDSCKMNRLNLDEQLMHPRLVQLCQQYGGSVGQSKKNDNNPSSLAVGFYDLCWKKYSYQGGNMKMIHEPLLIQVIKDAAKDWERCATSKEEALEHSRQTWLKMLRKEQAAKTTLLNKRLKHVTRTANSNKRSQRFSPRCKL